MTKKADLRMEILFQLGCAFNGTSLVHTKGVEVAHWELDSLEEIKFLEVVVFLTDKSTF